MNLVEYEQLKFRLGDLLRTLSERAKASDWRESVGDRLRAFAITLAEDNFGLMVWGDIGHGRTSLINALLGAKILPTDTALPTRIPCSLAYGDKEDVLLEQTGGGRHLDSLSELAAQWDDPGAARRVTSAEIKAPAETLRQGFRFVDCDRPTATGLNHSGSEHAAFIDAYLLVVSYPGPLGLDALDCLGSSDPGRTLIVLNKHDTVEIDARAACLARLRSQVADRLGGTAPDVFSVSARAGLAAKLAHDPAALQASGMLPLEGALINLVVSEKIGKVLQPLCGSLSSLIHSLPAGDVGEMVREVESILSAMDRMAASRRFDGGPAGDDRLAPGIANSPAPCEICERVREASFDFLRRYQHELIASPEARRAYAMHGGFCREHLRLYAALSSPYGICVGHSTLFDALSNTLGAAADRPGGPRSGEADSDSPWDISCPACPVDELAEATAIEDLCRKLRDDPQGTASTLSMLCLPHLSLILNAVRDDEVARLLLSREAMLLARLADDMRRYAIKYEAVRRNLVSSDEADAAGRALSAIAGLSHGVAHRPEG